MKPLTDNQIRIMRAWSNDNEIQREVQRRVEEARRWLIAVPVPEGGTE